VKRGPVNTGERQSSSGSEGGQRAALRRRMVAGTAGYVVLRATTGALGVLASLFLYRLLGPDQAGRLQLVLAMGMTLGAVAGLGFYETLARFVPERSAEEGPGLYRRALTLNGLALTVGGAVFVLLWVLGWGLPPEVRRVGVLFMIFSAAYALYTTTLGMLRGRGMLTTIPRLDLGANFGAKALAVGAVLLVPGFVSAFVAQVAMQLAMLALAFWLVRDVFRHRPGRLRREETRFGALILVGTLLQLLLSTVDLYVLRILLGPHEVGLFAAGSRIPVLAERIVLSPMGVPLLYYFSHPEYGGMRESVVRRGTRLSGTVLGYAALLLAAAAPLIIRILLGNAYLESIGIARVYAAHALGMGLLIFSIPLYGSLNHPEYGIVQGVVTFVINLGLDLLLIPRFGPVGAAYAGVTAIGVTALGAAWFFHARLNIDVRWPVAGVVLLYAVCFALITSPILWVGLALYPVAVWPLRLVRREDFALLIRGRRVA
jgi:O-antigen/teichoic acid export membrane protein